MADTLDIPKIPASEKPVSDDFEYAYVETVNKAFVRIAKERLKEILNANRYTNEEIDQKISTIPKFNIKVVSSLPTTDISETTIYLVSSGDDSENLYTEYININGLWEILGTQKSTFSGSAKDVTYDDTETKLGATNVQDAVGKLSATIDDIKQNGTGTTVTGGSVKTILENMMTIMKAQVNEDGKPQLYNPDVSSIVSQTDRLIANLGTTDDGGEEEEEPDTPVEPDVPEVTLSSISATYTGGDVTVGTALTDLTGITVTGTYSDGSTSAITGYTLSGEIVEGSNTITVSYNGLTTTFTVTGIAEIEEVVPLYTLESVENAVVESANKNQTGTVTVSNGNHISIKTEASSEWFWNMNVSSGATNGVSGTGSSVSATDTWFTIPSGAVVKMCVKNVSLSNGNHLRYALGVDNSNHAIYKFASGDEVTAPEFTFTADSDIAVPCITISARSNDSTKIYEAEFDVELYVDGVRWI